MTHLDVIQPGVNPARLDAELRASLGESCAGLTVCGDRVRVFVTDDLSPARRAEIEAIVHTHDPDALTPEQAAREARQQLPFFTLSHDELAELVAGMDNATFRRELIRAFAHLRDLLAG